MELQAGGMGEKLSRTCPTGFPGTGLTRAQGEMGVTQLSQQTSIAPRLSALL